jgi:HK97 family phage major capsid protein/HK97 family phage prohead protease
MTVIHKTTVAQAAGDPLTFVLSDATKDRMGDVIEPKGWQLDNFRSNPMALFNHNSSFPIGSWEDVKVQGERLVGKLKLAARGTSDRIDEIISLVEQGILRAVSVGFAPIEHEFMKDNSGIHFTKQELLETSLVSIPANPAAVQLAKSLHVSDATMGIVFGKHATADVIHKGEGILSAAQGKELSTFHRKLNQMEPTTTSQRIALAQERLVALKDQLESHLSTIDDEEPDEAALGVADDFKKKISVQERHLQILKDSEDHAINQVEKAGVRESGTMLSPLVRRPWAAPKKEIQPADILIRTAIVAGLARHRQQDPATIIREEYGDDPVIKGIFPLVCRAASAPAMTTTTGWAAELVTTLFSNMIDTLMPFSVYPGLSARGGRFNFGRNGVISIPARNTATTVAGSFVGQGSPIPVRQGAFTVTTLTPKSLKVITTFTREMAEHSTPQIEAVLRRSIVEDTQVAIDSVLLDATAASAIRPAGLRNGVSVITGTAGANLAALVADIKAAVAALTTSTNGNLRNPVWIMHPNQVTSIQFQTNANGEFLFQNEIQAGNFRGFPLLQLLKLRSLLHLIRRPSIWKIRRRWRSALLVLRRLSRRQPVRSIRRTAWQSA